MPKKGYKQTVKMTKAQLQAKLNDINVQLQQLHDEGMKIVGQIDLLTEQEKTTAEEAITKPTA